MWPSSPLTSYLAGGTPAIKAFDLNAFQSAINGIINATYSLLGVVIDGTGGNVVTPVAGAMQVTSSRSGATFPTTAVPWGAAFKDALLLGSAQVTEAAGALTFTGGYNVDDVTRNGQGDYSVRLGSAPTNADRCSASIVPFFTAAFVCPKVTSFAIAANKLTVSFFLFDSATQALADAGFLLTVYGG